MVIIVVVVCMVCFCFEVRVFFGFLEMFSSDSVVSLLVLFVRM